jgi:chromosome segregation ATPase
VVSARPRCPAGKIILSANSCTDLNPDTRARTLRRDADTQIQQMTARLADAEHARGAADAAAHAAHTAAAEHQRRAEQAQAAAADANRRAAEVADALAAATARAETAENIAAAHAASLEHLRHELTLVRADAQAQVDATRRETAAANQRAAQAEASRDRAHADNVAHQQAIAALRDELTAASAEAAAATAQAEAAEKRLDGLLAARPRGASRTRPA